MSDSAMIRTAGDARGGRLESSQLLDSSLYSPPTPESALSAKLATRKYADVIDFADYGDIYAQKDKARKTGVEVQVKGTVSFEYRERAQHWIDSLPATIKQKIVAHGITIVLAEHAEDARKTARTEAARGHHPGETMAMQPGFYSPEQKSLVLVERPEMTPLQKQTIEAQKNTTAYFGGTGFKNEIAWHELGHALDFASEHHMTQGAAFVAAYRSDLESMPKPYPTNLSYFIPSARQQEPGAREEALAELFMRAHKPPSMQTDGDRQMLKLFPNSLNEMKRHGLL